VQLVDIAPESDLQTWMPLNLNANLSGLIEIVDGGARAIGVRFYRARVPAQ
jgi:uncharacterized membrane-anchored protein